LLRNLGGIIGLLRNPGSLIGLLRRNREARK
jgi:hypothetical protein